MPERREDGKIYNTCTCFDTSGNLATKYTKCHLFDIDIPGKVKIAESDFYNFGHEYAIFDTEFCKFGLGI